MNRGMIIVFTVSMYIIPTVEFNDVCSDFRSKVIFPIIHRNVNSTWHS
jgi:hypothetical protein